jgi:polyketide cyclase/dehydrase/lipid transport protein
VAEPGRKGSSVEAPTDALKEAGQQMVGLLVQRAAQATTDRVTNLSGKLTNITENGGTGVVSALRGGDRKGDDESQDEDGDGRSGIGGFFGNLKDKVAGVFGGGGGGGKGKKLKVTVISETLDIGLPLRTTYNLWTQYGDFPSFMKKVESADQDDEKSNWKAQVFWSHREWQATTVEQVPDSHIVWKSTGAKGHVDGAVTFTEIGRNLTRILLVMEYFPQGFFERTGNIWRAQGRRARLEFQHFRRHAMTDVLLHPEDIEGWRGEIRDSEVVKTHEEGLEEEQRRGAEEEREEEPRGEGAEETEEDEGVERDEEYEPSEDDEEYEPSEDDESEYEAADDRAEDDGEYDDYDDEERSAADDRVDEGDGGADDYDEDAEYDEYDEDADEEDAPEPAADEGSSAAEEDYDDRDQEVEGNGRRRRQPVGARSGRRR